MTMPNQPWGTTDVGAVREDAEKSKGGRIKVPSPGGIIVRLMPPWKAGEIRPYYKWILHYNMMVEGYQGPPICV